MTLDTDDENLRDRAVRGAHMTTYAPSVIDPRVTESAPPMARYMNIAVPKNSARAWMPQDLADLSVMVVRD